MKHRSSRHRLIFALWLSSLIAASPLSVESSVRTDYRALIGQGGKVGATKGKPGETKAGEGKGKAGATKSTAPPESSTQIKVVEKIVQAEPNIGYLSVATLQGAQVTLTSLVKTTKRGQTTLTERATSIKDKPVDESGTLTLASVPPGKYKVSIQHPDYDPHEEVVEVRKGNPSTVNTAEKLISKYGSIVIGGAAPETLKDAALQLDGQEIDPSTILRDTQGITISKVAAGKHRLRVAKKGHADFYHSELEVFPGKPTVIAIKFDPGSITLTISSEPGADVYADNEKKGTIQPEGRVAISLQPGSHRVRVVKDGFKVWEKQFNLSLQNRTVNEVVALVPIPRSVEEDWSPVSGAKKWFPAKWTPDQAGALISGEEVVLFDTEPERDFNIYDDFKLEFDLKFANGKGAAWLARARDANNYYLFELNGPQSSNPRTFKFYICRNGRLELLDTKPVVERLDVPDDSYHIIFEARGDRFETKLSSTGQPTPQPMPIGIFHDRSFSFGGIGFRGKDGIQMRLLYFVVAPRK